MSGDARAMRCWILLGLVALAMSSTEFGQLEWRIDQGLYTSEAARYVSGEVPFRDVFNSTPPVTGMLLAACYTLFGVKLWLGPALVMLLSLAATLICYALCRRVLDGPAALLPPLLMAVTIFSPGSQYNHHELSTVLALLAILLWTRHQESDSWMALVGCGATLALTGLTLQHKGGFLLLVMLGYFALSASQRGRRVRSIALLSAGLSLIGAPLLAFLLATGAVGHAWHNVVIFPFTNYLPTHVVPYPWSVPWKVDWTRLTRSPLAIVSGSCWQLLMAALVYGPLVLHPLLAAVLWRDRQRFGQIRPTVLLYLLSSLALFGATIHHFRTQGLLLASPLMWILLLVLTQGGDQRRHRITRALCIALLGCLLLVGLGQRWKSWRRPGVTVQTPAGQIALQPRLARELAAVKAAIGPDLRAGEYVFCYYHIPLFYQLLGVRNPTRYAILFHDYTAPEQVQEILHDLERHRPRFILRHGNFLGSWSSIPRIDAYIERHYRQVGQGERIGVWRRQPD